MFYVGMSISDMEIITVCIRHTESVINSMDFGVVRYRKVEIQKC